MEINLPAGQTYVVAVSGGVDSAALLDMLVRSSAKEGLVVAHFDHGIRPESALEAAFVGRLAKKHGLTFVAGAAELGHGASEARAREARYGFLEDVRQQHRAVAIVLAHHQDDFLETAIMNFRRGSRRRGLVSLQSTKTRLRPLLGWRKSEIIAYARSRQLKWHEDDSNQDVRYLRNYVRQTIMPRLKEEERTRLLSVCAELAELNRQLDELLENYLRLRSYRRQGRVFSRSWFERFSHEEACEIVATWLIQYKVRDYTQNQINYIVVKLKTLRPGKMIVVGSDQTIRLTKRCLRLEL